MNHDDEGRAAPGYSVALMIWLAVSVVTAALWAALQLGARA